MSRRVNQIAVKEKQSQVTVENQIHQVSTDKVIRHNLNVGPPGPPGSGLQITGVVNTASELPPNAAPGDAYLVTETNTVSAWVAGAWWNLGGPMQGPQGEQGPEGPEGPQGPKGDTGPPPQINDLPTRPGGPQPTDEIWLASAGGAADFKANFNALLQFVASNMSTITSGGNGRMLKLPPLGLELATHWVNAGSLSAGQVTEVVWEFPSSFGDVPHVLALSKRGSFAAPRQIDAFAASATSVTFRVEDIRSSGGAQTATFDALAIRIG